MPTSRTSWSQVSASHTTQKKVLKQNNLPELDLGNGNSWGDLLQGFPTKNTKHQNRNYTHTITVSPQPPLPDLGPQHEPETELFTTPQRKPTSTPAPMPIQSPVRPHTTKTNTYRQSPQKPKPQPTQPDKPKTTHTPKTHRRPYRLRGHRGGNDLNPKSYGIRLFPAEPSRYKYLNRLQLAHGITRGTIIWIYTNTTYQTRSHEGNMFIQPNMTEKIKNKTWNTFKMAGTVVSHSK